LLTLSLLQAWMQQEQVDLTLIGLITLVGLPYTFKFLWAPIFDRFRLPFLGRRRGWLCLIQALLILAIAGLGQCDPKHQPLALGLMALVVAFLSASQDIVIDAYRIEIARPEQQGLLSSAYIAGYRVGMIVAGAGALFLASYWGSAKGSYSYAAWQSTYLVMAAVMGVGLLTTLLTPEPQRAPVTSQRGEDAGHSGQHLRLLLVFLTSVAAFVLVFYQAGQALGGAQTAAGPVASLLLEAVRLAAGLACAFGTGWLLVRLGLASREQARATWVEPVLDFFRRYGASTAWLVLALVGLYRISDIVLGVISNVFYQDIGFSKPEIAYAVKTFGVVVSIVGGFAGGILATRIGVMRSLMWGAVLSALTNLGFVALAHAGHDVPLMYAVVAADNLAAGFASAAFVAFLSSLTNVSFTAVQYAIFSSLMTLLPKTLGGYSGGMVDAMGYAGFFWFTTLVGLPVMLLVWRARRRLAVDEPGRT
jgi:PAT family beta-lactamase induction signal transducer AmpG